MSDRSKLPGAGPNDGVAWSLPDWADASETSQDELAELLADLAGLLPPETAAADLRERLLAAAGGSQRYAPFTSRLRRLFDLDEPAIDACLARVDDPTEWQAFPMPGVQLLHLDGGPATAGADVGLVRIAPETEFPHHKHLGQESVLVLHGSYLDDDGREYVAGDVSVKATDTEHKFRAGSTGCTFAVVVYGVEIDGVRIGA